MDEATRDRYLAFAVELSLNAPELLDELLEAMRAKLAETDARPANCELNENIP